MEKMAMIKDITRNDVDGIIRSTMKVNENSVIITGLDSSGKSTVISKYYPEFTVFKFDSIVSEEYMSDSTGVYKWLGDYYQIYDRFPLVDWFVYNSVSESWSNDKLESELSNYIEGLKNKVIIFFENDKYFSIKPHSNDTLVKDNRDKIKDTFNLILEFISSKLPNLEIYRVTD